MNWIFGRDCSREIFSKLSFNERQRIRLVCKSWNTWIIEYKNFWPLEYSLYSSVIRNLQNESFKQTRVKITHTFSRLLIFDLGIILVSFKENDEGFWIYSRDTFELLYHFKEPLSEIVASKNYIIIHDFDKIFWLLCFECKGLHCYNIKKTKLFEENINFDVCSFKYPFVSFYNDVLMDVRTGINILKENNVQIPDDCVSEILTEKYFVLGQYTHRLKKYLIYLNNDIKKPPLKIKNPGRIHIHNSDIFFNVNYSYIKGTIIEIYNINTKEKKDIVIDTISPQYIDDSFIFGFDQKDSDDEIEIFKIFKWNSDYTDFTLQNNINNVSFSYKIDCFHPTLPFYALKFEDSIKIISKQDGKEITEFFFSKESSNFFGDNTRIYFEIKNNLHFIDFAF